MIPSIVKKWQTVKSTILIERDRILNLVTLTSHKIQDSCGQIVTQLPVTVGCYTYTFQAAYRDNYGQTASFQNFYSNGNCHWGNPLTHYQDLLKILVALTESEIEFAMLRILEKDS